MSGAENSHEGILVTPDVQHLNLGDEEDEEDDGNFCAFLSFFMHSKL